MILDPTSSNHLKPWLVRTLEPICDAEPNALGDYILALMRHDVGEAEMRKELSSQLEEFLERETPAFLDQLFTVLRTKSYLPYSDIDNSPAAPISPSSSSRGVKRSIDHDSRDSRPPKGPRLAPNEQHGHPYVRGSAPGAWLNQPVPVLHDPRNGPMPVDMSQSGNNGPHGRDRNAYATSEHNRPICRDYHNKGYCARGAMCKFSHGDDAFVPAQMFQHMQGMQGMPFNPAMFQSGVSPYAIDASTYNPADARMDMSRPPNILSHPPTHNQTAHMPLIPHIPVNGGHPGLQYPHTNEEMPVIQDLTPAISDSISLGTPMREEFGGYIHQPDGYTPMTASTYMDINPKSRHNFSSVESNQRGRAGGAGRRRDGSGPGVFAVDAPSLRPGRKNDITLVVEKIPGDKLNLDAVNGWFKRFGAVTNVAIDPRGGKALVSFATHNEAQTAWKSEEAIFGNRFVKIFWHRPLEGHGQTGTRSLQASASLVASLNGSNHKSPAEPSSSNLTASSNSTPVPSSSAAPLSNSAKAALAAKQRTLEGQIAEQKVLMAQLGSVSPDRKKEIMKRLRSLNEEMKTQPVETETAPQPSTAADTKPSVKDTASPSSPGGVENLKDKLAKLKAEAAILGLTEANGFESSPSKPSRGRGRGRGSFRGATRVGPPRGSMKLDNRSRKLIIKGAPEGSLLPIRSFYDATNQVEGVEEIDSNHYVVSFKSRSAAEQGLSLGTDVSSVGKVQISWYTPNLASGALEKSSSESKSKATPRFATNSTNLEPHTKVVDAADHQEEEEVASGWGNEDGEDGMGLM